MTVDFNDFFRKIHLLNNIKMIESITFAFIKIN